MKLSCLTPFLIVALASLVWSGSSDDSTVTPVASPLTIYSGGLGVGAFRPLNDSLKMESKAFFDASFINDVYLADRVHLFADFGWMAPHRNFGADFGLDFLLASGAFRPFAGAGVGFRYFDKVNYSFGENFGPSGTAHLGMVFDLTPSTQVRIRVPFRAVLNDTRDFGLGLEAGILFSAPYRRVKKLNY